MAAAPMLVVAQSPDIIPGASNNVDARPVEAAVLQLDAVLTALADLGINAIRWMESAIAQANAFGPACSRDDFERLTADDAGKGGITSGMQRALAEGKKTPSADQVMSILEGVTLLLARRPHVAASTDLSGESNDLATQSTDLSVSVTPLSKRARLATQSDGLSIARGA